MTVAVLAEAGLSECARDTACSADFDRSVYELLVKLALLGVIVTWFAISVAATVHIAYSPTVGARSAGWISAVWLLPFVGAVAWWVESIRAARRWRAAAADDRFGSPPPPGP